MERVRCKLCGKLVPDSEDVRRHHMSRHVSGQYARPDVCTDNMFEVFGMKVTPEDACLLFSETSNDDHRKDSQAATK